MRKNAFKIKSMMGIGSILLCTSELSVASEDERVFQRELERRCGLNMELVNDVMGAESALKFFSSWVHNPNPTIQQTALREAEVLVEKWVLNRPYWLPLILPQIQETAEQIYQVATSRNPNEPPELTETKDNTLDLLEEVTLQAKMEGEEGILPKSLADDIVKQHPEAQQQVEEAKQKREAAKEAECQEEQRKQAQQEVDEKLEAEQQVEQKEQARRDAEAQAEIEKLHQDKQKLEVEEDQRIIKEEQERRDKEAAKVLERQRKQREQEQQKLHKKLEEDQRLIKEEQERRDKEAAIVLERQRKQREQEQQKLHKK